eukprot:COSAG01_NODE_11357_length_1952_cov_1.785753_3_plen_48_part_01
MSRHHAAAAVARACSRVRVETMGPQKWGIAAKSQSVLMMINAMIFTRT